MRHKDCLNEQRAATRELLTVFEDICKRYNVHPKDYNNFRAMLKSKMFRIMNIWHLFFATVVDAKFHKKVNEDGEDPKTHLKDDNGQNTG